MFRAEWSHSSLMSTCYLGSFTPLEKYNRSCKGSGNDTGSVVPGLRKQSALSPLSLLIFTVTPVRPEMLCPLLTETQA